MKPYQADFVKFLVRNQALKFGDFTLKSGRKSPYFVNMGAFDDGPSLLRLGEFYAGLLADKFEGSFNVLFGPAYKGIPLATTSAAALFSKHGIEVKVSFDRKESKGHGERGRIFGHVPKDGDRVVIIDDVFTTGETKEEAADLLAGLGDVACTGVAIAVDRQEAQKDGRSAVQIFETQRSIPVHSIVNIRQIVDFLSKNEVEGRLVIDAAMTERIGEYLKKYGTRQET
jgi:orotate phosphoribosyltransferase